MKNKYFYPIYKLKIKSWIKYWLIKQTEFKGVLSDILEGISFYLTDSLNMKFKMFDIIGRSVQDGDPTPENPVPIKNTGDNGSVNEKVQNKNLAWNGWAEDFVSRINNTTKATLETKDNRNCLKYAASAGYQEYDTKYLFKTNWKTNTRYTISFDVFTTSADANFYIKYTDGTNSYIENVTTNTWKAYTLTSTANKTIKYLRVSYSLGTTYIDLDTFMVEEGTTATPYVPHSEQNISFPLAQGQKLYQDEELKENGKDDIWSEIVFDGTEDGWIISSSTSNRTIFRISVPLIENYSNENVIPNILSSHFIARSQAITWEPGDISRVKNEDNIFIIMQANMSITNFKSYLAEQYANGTPVTVIYKKANPTITPYTEGQQRYYDEHIKPLRTYKNVTHISSEDETPAELKIQYWKEV